MANSKVRTIKGQHFQKLPNSNAGSNSDPLFVSSVNADRIIFKQVETVQELRLELRDFNDCRSDFRAVVSDFISFRLAKFPNGRCFGISDSLRTENSNLMQRFRRSRDKLVARFELGGQKEMATALGKFQILYLIGDLTAGVTPGLSNQDQETYKQNYRNLTLAERYIKAKTRN